MSYSLFKTGDGAVQMCRALAKGAIFKLRAGDFVHLWEGAFLRPPDLTPGQPVLGSQALDFIQRELPLFDVPWSVKAAMDASGVSQKDCREINPPILRCARWLRLCMTFVRGGIVSVPFSCRQCAYIPCMKACPLLFR